jgi:hypothetical protein
MTRKSADKKGPRPDQYAKGWEAGVEWALLLVNDSTMSRADVFDAMFVALEDGRRLRAEASRKGKGAAL